MTPDPPAPRDLRGAAAEFATGVAVVTLADEGDDIGLTSTSLRSVSLDPPLVLVTVTSTSYVDELFSRCETWAVSVLAASQRQIAGRFAAAGRPSARLLLAGHPHHRGAASGALIIDGGVLALQCRTVRQFTAGDHRVVVGLVETIAPDPGEPGARAAPLVRHRGAYSLLG